jgi:hypothetical protein
MKASKILRLAQKLTVSEWVWTALGEAFGELDPPEEDRLASIGYLAAADEDHLLVVGMSRDKMRAVFDVAISMALSDEAAR